MTHKILPVIMSMHFNFYYVFMQGLLLCLLGFLASGPGSLWGQRINSEKDAKLMFSEHISPRVQKRFMDYRRVIKPTNKVSELQITFA